MRTYVTVSAVVFDVIATAQLVRFLMDWPVMIAGYDVPRWMSGVAAVLLGALAVWGMRWMIKLRAAPAT